MFVFVSGSGDMSIMMISHSSWSVGMYTCTYVCLCLEINVKPGHEHRIYAWWLLGLWVCIHVLMYVCGLCLEVGT